MKLHCIAILNRQDSPIYLRNFDAPSDDVKYHSLAYTSCDVIEERMASSKSNDLFLGLLQTVEELSVYGYVLNTGVRIILVLSVPESMVRSSSVREMFQQIHAAYIAMVCNPFNEELDGLSNAKFESIISELSRIHSETK
ncbi:hypothetical protein GGI04_000463 [Coemansia thaxteri]|nr:hypothetical protein GGI04_000463 [Coemansia thaxteri]